MELYEKLSVSHLPEAWGERWAVKAWNEIGHNKTHALGSVPCTQHLIKSVLEGEKFKDTSRILTFSSFLVTKLASCKEGKNKMNLNLRSLHENGSVCFSGYLFDMFMAHHTYLFYTFLTLTSFKSQSNCMARCENSWGHATCRSRCDHALSLWWLLPHICLFTKSLTPFLFELGL